MENFYEIHIIYAKNGKWKFLKENLQNQFSLKCEETDKRFEALLIKTRTIYKRHNIFDIKTRKHTLITLSCLNWYESITYLFDRNHCIGL